MKYNYTDVLYYLIRLRLDINSLSLGLCNCPAEADAPILWPPDANSQLIGKDPDAEKG